MGLYCRFIGVILPVQWGYIAGSLGLYGNKRKKLPKIVVSLSLHRWRTQTARTKIVQMGAKTVLRVKYRRLNPMILKAGMHVLK